MSDLIEYGIPEDDAYIVDEEYEKERESMSFRDKQIELFVYLAEITGNETKH